MSTQIVARRYARALYEVAEKEKALEKVDGDIDVLQLTLDESRTLRQFFASPVIPRDRKKAVVESLFSGRFHALTLRFIKMLIEQRREQLILRIATGYRSLRDEQLGIVTADARVAVDLAGNEVDLLTQRLRRLTGRDVRLTVKNDASLIGGVIVRINDTIYDGSVRHQLSLMRDRLSGGSALN